MDAEQLRHLTDGQRDAYRRQMATMESPGWVDIERWARANYEAATARQLDSTTWDASRIAYGARAAFELLAKLRDTTEAQFVELAAQKAGELAVEVTEEYE